MGSVSCNLGEPMAIAGMPLPSLAVPGVWGTVNSTQSLPRPEVAQQGRGYGFSSQLLQIWFLQARGTRYRGGVAMACSPHMFTDEVIPPPRASFPGHTTLLRSRPATTGNSSACV